MTKNEKSRDTSHKQLVEQIKLLSNLPDISHEPRYRVKLTGNHKITKKSILLSVERPATFTFLSGQYVWLVLPKQTADYGTIDRRAFSIASGQNDQSIEFIVRLTDSNFMSRIAQLKAGDEIDIIGPMGSAFMAGDKGVIMLAGGSGVSPFLPILSQKPLDKNVELTIYYSESDRITNDARITHLRHDFEDRVAYRQARPQLADFSKIAAVTDERPIFIAGSQNYVDFITMLLLKSKIESSRLHYEANYPQSETNKKLIDRFNSLSDDDQLDEDSSLPRLSELFLQATKQTSSHVIITDSNGRILFANQAAVDITGYTFNEMRGQTPRLWGGVMPKDFYKEIWSNLKSGQAVKKAMINRRRDGSLYTVIVTITPIMHNGEIVIFIANEENISAIREVDQAKTEFVSIASHQLRTPLSVINWYTEMLVKGSAGKLSDKQNQYLQVIYAADKHMIELVSALLDVSRLELGTFAVDPRLVDISELINSTVDEQTIQIKEKKMKVEISTKAKLPLIEVDPKLMQMVIQNLLSNSIKYTPNGGKIKISVALFDKTAILMTFSDNGYGIPKNQQERIFTKLFRAENIRTKVTEGTGLGLYIVKSIINQSGGEIWFESEENKGTTFYIKLPIKLAKNVKLKQEEEL